MSKSLKLRKLKRKHLPYGKFHYQLILNSGKMSNRRYNPRENLHECKEICDLLDRSGRGKYRKNCDEERCYDIFLTDVIDLTLVKMCFGAYLVKIYEIEITE